MLGSRMALAGIALAILGLSGFASKSWAQGEVPGGWAPQVGFQSFSGGGIVGASSYQGFGSILGGLPAPYGGFAGFSAQQSAPALAVTPNRTGVVNGLVPLADTIRRHARRRAVR
jgi:hypothetical protein